MNIDFVISFVMLFGATIALVCAMYVLLIVRDARKKQMSKQKKEEYIN